MHWLRYALAASLLLVPNPVRVGAQSDEAKPHKPNQLREPAPSIPRFERDSQGYPRPASPAGLAERLRQAYQSRDLAVYSRLFTDDFRFFFSDPDLKSKYPGGWKRRDELAAAQHLFEGSIRDDGEWLPPARTIELDFEDVTIHPNRARLDSADYYQLVDIQRVYLRVQTEDGVYFVNGDHHQFWVVRGDKALLSDPELRDPSRWYIHKWVENPPAPSAVEDDAPDEPVVAETGEESSTELEQEAGAETGWQPVTFGLQPVFPNPATQPFELNFVLIGIDVAFLQLFDVRGRQIWQRTVGQLGPGPHRVRYDGERLEKGVYWVRIVQGSRVDSQRLTILR